MRFCSPRGAETADGVHDERILRQPLAERAEVLLGEHRGRHQHGDLPAVVDGLESGPHGQLGLAVADVAADEPIHGPAALHVAFDFGHRRELIGCFAKGKGGLELRAAIRCREES